MSNIIVLVVLVVLALPLLVLVRLFTLGEAVRKRGEKLDYLGQRVDRLERELLALRSASTEVSPLAPLESAPEEFAPQPDASTGVPPSDEAPERELAPESPPIPTFVPEFAPLASPPPILHPKFAEPIVAASTDREPATATSFAETPKPAFALNWEQFMGAKLFAWIGGFVLFLGMAFFVKYSFERNLIPPELRVAIGFVVGVGLMVAGVLVKRRELTVTSQSLCATGVVIVYAVAYACRSVYHFDFFGPVATFALMALTTAVAFVLAVELDALVVAILGLLGGFLTPLLLSTGQDNPSALFSYIALLDIGLLAVAFRRDWPYLSILGALGTAALEVGWVANFFAVEKVFIAMAIFLGFDVLFLAAFLAGGKRQRSNTWLTASAAGLSFLTLGFVLYLAGGTDLGHRPGVLFSFALGADVCLLLIELARSELSGLNSAAGGMVFLALSIWMGRFLNSALLGWGLGLTLFYAALHSLFPILLRRWRGGTQRAWLGQLFPPLALVMVLIPILKFDASSLLVWPAVLLLDGLAVGLVLLTGSLVCLLAGLVLTLVLTGVWITQIPLEASGTAVVLSVIGGFAVFFYLSGWWVGKKISHSQGQSTDNPLDALFANLSDSDFLGRAFPVPVLSAILPFLLLIMMVQRLPLSNPAPVFGLALFLILLLLGTSVWGRIEMLAPVGLACAMALEFVWHQTRFDPAHPMFGIGWYLVFYGVFTVFPFLFQKRWAERVLPWATAALSGPLHFLLIYPAVTKGFQIGYPGLLPAAFAVPMFAALAQVARAPLFRGTPMRLNLLAWFSGTALFFVTLIFPVQFRHQWITIGWALEGLALVWLFHRIPHPGLRATGVVLLVVAFARLALNPAVLDYHRSSEWRVFNWYLYAYGIVTICLMLAARSLAPPRHRVWDQNILPLLYTLGTVLAFLLVNIEIADYFAEGPTLTFQFSGNFARDMSYSMAWAIFGLGLLVVGIWKRVAPVRYAAMGLLVVTLLKLFLHDLSELGQLYRIGAFLVVAVILMLASFLYQRFVSFDLGAKQTGS